MCLVFNVFTENLKISKKKKILSTIIKHFYQLFSNFVFNLEFITVLMLIDLDFKYKYKKVAEN